MKASVQVSARRLTFVIPSRLEAVDTVCLELRSFLLANELSKACFVVELVARECLNNAILHGNQCQEDKKASLNLCLGRRWIRLEITDEGAGFNWRQSRRMKADATATHGRGLSIGSQYAGRMRFNRKGNRITLWLENGGISKR